MYTLPFFDITSQIATEYKSSLGRERAMATRE